MKRRQRWPPASFCPPPLGSPTSLAVREEGALRRAAACMRIRSAARSNSCLPSGNRRSSGASLYCCSAWRRCSPPALRTMGCNDGLVLLVHRVQCRPPAYSNEIPRFASSTTATCAPVTRITVREALPAWESFCHSGSQGPLRSGRYRRRGGSYVCRSFPPAAFRASRVAAFEGRERGLPARRADGAHARARWSAGEEEASCP